jgi:HD superfamily phosphohydrolase
MSKIIFVKSMDEYKTEKNKPYKLQIGNHETNNKIAVANRIRGFFEEVKSDKEHVFMEDVEEANDGTTKKIQSTIKTKAERLYKIVSLLQGVDLKNTELDAKGRAFEQFLDTVFKSKLGQYFTHRNIVNFCVCLIDPQEKEFIIDPYQIYLGRSHGADAVLLIAAILTDPELTELQALIHELGMAALVEVHTQAELERVLQIPDVRLIGINNRNLENFVVELEQTKILMDRLDPLTRDKYLWVSESGIYTRHDLDFVQSCGASAVLVGESLIKLENIELAVSNLLEK